MSDTLVALGEVVAIVAAGFTMGRLPRIINAVIVRIRGPHAGCADCGDALNGTGATCATCRDIRRERLARGPDGRAAAESNGDNGS